MLGSLTCGIFYSHELRHSLRSFDEQDMLEKWS